MKMASCYCFALMVCSLGSVPVRSEDGSEKMIAQARSLMFEEAQLLFVKGQYATAEQCLTGLALATPQSGQWRYEVAQQLVGLAFHFKSKGSEALSKVAAERAMAWLEQASASGISEKDSDLLGAIYESAAIISENFIGDTSEAIELYKAAATVSGKAKSAYETWARRQQAQEMAAKRQQNAPRS